jgi:hypothetical protein
MHKAFLAENLFAGWMMCEDPPKQPKTDKDPDNETVAPDSNKLIKVISTRTSAKNSFASGEDTAPEVLTVKLLLLGASPRAKSIFWEGCITDYTYLDPTFLDSRFVTESMIFKDFFLEMTYVSDLEPPLEEAPDREKGSLSSATKSSILKRNSSVLKSESFKSTQENLADDSISGSLKYTSEMRRGDAAVITFDWSDSPTIESAYRWTKWITQEFPLVRVFLLGIRQDEVYLPTKDKTEQFVNDIKSEFEVYQSLDLGAGYYKTIRRDVQAIINSLVAEVRIVKDEKLNQALRMSFRVV